MTSRQLEQAKEIIEMQERVDIMDTVLKCDITIAIKSKMSTYNAGLNFLDDELKKFLKYERDELVRKLSELVSED